MISGQIKKPDRLFNDLAAHIYTKYMAIGLELGLKVTVLEDELETGVFASSQGSKKALKMLQLWQNDVTDDDYTYSVLAAALEKHGFRRVADRYCYVNTGILHVLIGNYVFDYNINLTMYSMQLYTMIIMAVLPLQLHSYIHVHIVVRIAFT